MTVSPNRRVIAIAERINDHPSVTIYDLQTGKRRKTLQPETMKSSDIVSLLFSSDSKYLLTQGGGPDCALIYWSWEKGKVMASIDVKPTAGSQGNATVNQVRCLPLSDALHRPSEHSRCRSILKTTRRYARSAMVCSECSGTMKDR